MGKILSNTKPTREELLDFVTLVSRANTEYNRLEELADNLLIRNSKFENRR